MKRLILLMLGLVIVCIAACDVSSPDRFVRAPIIRSFSPENPYFNILRGDTVTFSVSAIDPDDGALRFDFVLGDSVVSGDDTWTYVVHDTGVVDVSARVYNRKSRSSVSWRLVRVAPQNLPPVIVDYQPTDPNPSVRIRESISFSMTAQDPEGQPLSYIFTVNDSLVSGSNRFTYLPVSIGQYSVKSIVSDGAGFATHEWGLLVLGEPDSIRPAPVVLSSLETGQETGELVATWVAVGDDSLDGLPAAYVVRTSPVPIDDEASWAQASDRPGEPAPELPGQTQQMVIRFLPPAVPVYVTVRARDESGNLSALSNSTSALVKGNDVLGTIRDAESGAPIAGVTIRLAGDEAVTDASGSYWMSNVPDGTDRIRLADEDDPQAYGSYYDMRTDPYVVKDEDVRDFWMIPNLTMQSTKYESFLDFVLQMTIIGGPFGELLRTWNEPVDVYVIPFVNNGLDYKQVINDALLEWEDVVGLDLFRIVDSVPEVGFYVTYSSIVDRDFYRAIESDLQLLPVVGEIVMRTLYDASDPGFLDRVAGHEIGHALGLLGHSVDTDHMMVGSIVNQAEEPTLDEIRLMRVVYRLPRGQSMLWFLRD